MTIDSGRIKQKLRTRTNLIEAANRLLQAGNAQFSLEEVAKEANVSTATAYRYFSSAEILRLEAPLQHQTRTPEKLFEGTDASDWYERLDKLISYFAKLNLENETEFRLFLSSALRESVVNSNQNLRGRRRLPLTEEALEELKLKIPSEDFEKLICTISIFLGIESVVVLKDVCQLPSEDVPEIWKWAIHHIITSLLNSTR